MSTINDDVYDEPEEPDFDTIRAQVDVDLDEDDDDDDALCWSDVELVHFTDRAMPHGRRAATWLLVGVLAELALLMGACAVVSLLHSVWLILPTALITSVAGAAIALTIKQRWERHWDRMARVIEDAMGWMAAAQRKELGEADRSMRRDHTKAVVEMERIEALREKLTWNVGPAPAFIGPNDLPAIAAALAEHARNEADELTGSNEPQCDDEPESPAVRAWMQRWADLKPVHRPRPARLEKRHSDAEGRRLERELCRAINKHWSGAFHTLLNQGANPNGHNNSGKPLRIAVLRGRLEYVSWLLTLGADVTTLCHGRTILSALMCQVADYIDEGDGEGDDFVWPEKLELLARWGANPHQMNRWYDKDDDSEGPNAWPFVTRWPVLYEAFMKGHQVWLQSDADAMRVLRDERESVGLAEVADTTRAMLDAARMGRA
ncbi:hypothetical protein [Burkholderia gladioli]|uniref:hypothetical protein n=1 Tax=Burkholderia gladioli TaxID=28095 RepID=UPI00163FB182|nr:hypothetical protein [Burkholderia gladioli]